VKSNAVRLLLSILLVLGLAGSGISAEAFELAVDVSGQGTVTPPAGTQSCEPGAVVRLTATPAPGWEFRYWLGDVSDPHASETQISMDSAKSVTAVFYSPAESILIAVTDVSGSPVPGVYLGLTDGSGSLETTDQGIAVLNTHASSTLIAPFLAGHTLQPQGAIAQKGDELSFVAYPEPPARLIYFDLTFNPVVFSNEDQLNPFASPRIREAMNRLLDREYMAEHIVAQVTGEPASPSLTMIPPVAYEYEFMSDVIAELEKLYSCDKQAAQEVIAEEMRALGAEWEDEKWFYRGKEVVLSFVIRTEAERRGLGEYIADELEAIGFTVDRIYMGAQEISADWQWRDPREGSWHLYTLAWEGEVRALGSPLLVLNYTPLAFSEVPLWRSYDPDPELLDAAIKLNSASFDSVEERKEVFRRGLELGLKYSVRIGLVSQP